MSKKPIRNAGFQLDQSNPSWCNIRINENSINHLWDNINHSVHEQTDAKKDLAGNISKSIYLQDKDNWFYENALKELCEYMYLKDWNNYLDVAVAKVRPIPKFILNSWWVNYQKQHEFNPPHNHSGKFSFVIFMKIPTHWKEQHALPISANSNAPCASDFQFLRAGISGMETVNIPLSPEEEGRLLLFPAWLGHQVFPFYGTEEERITVSGNIQLEADNED